MVKKRMTVFLEDRDRLDVEAIRAARKLDSDGAAIRYAIRAIAEQGRAISDKGRQE